MSSSNCYDLAVAYRICPVMSRMPPPICADSKYQLASLCLRSFKAALGDLNIKIWVLLDNCPPEYESLFTDLWTSNDLTLVRCPNIGNQGTFKQQIEILSRQNDSEYVYFAEDDYFYRPTSLRTMLDFLRNNPDRSFISPFHHPDYDIFELHPQHLRNKRNIQGEEWISELSTTCTFLTSRSTLVCTSKHLEIYGHRLARPAGDLAMWLCLTKRQIFNPLFFLRHLLHHRLFWAWSWLSAWLMGGRLILTQPRYTLWAPSHSYATHMNAKQIDNKIDWPRLWSQHSSTRIQAPQA